MSESILNLTVGTQNATQLPAEQKELLLETKLFIPIIRPKHVVRLRLIEEMHRGLDKALILVSAPAGYGKTTLISNWLRETDLPSAWISLDESDNDPLRFLQYFFTAIQRRMPTSKVNLLGMLQGMQPVPADTLINLLINEIAECASPFILVLDDFHLIEAQPILDMVTYLLEHIPPPMHLVLISRTDPPFPLSRLRARNELIEIRANHLRFTSNESTAFLNEAMGLKLSREDIATLETRTEGWIAGLQLAALSMQGTKDLHGFIQAFAGSHRYIMDYLAEEVLQFQPESVRLFLLKTSILGRMNGALCNAVVKLDNNDGQAILESLEQRNLFVVPLDDEKCWYRYHHLFTDVLNRYLEKQFPDEICELHRRASQWYEQNDFIVEAIHHSLAAGDQDCAVQLIELNGCMLMMRGEAFTLLNWMESTESYSQTRPWFAILKAWAFALTGYPERVGPILHSMDRFVTPTAPSLRMKVMLGSMAAVRAYVANMYGDTGQAIHFAQQALTYLPNRVPFSRSLRSLTTSILGDANWIDGNPEKARQAYIEAAQIARVANNIHLAIITNSHIAETLAEQGQLRQAARTYVETLEMAQSSPLAARVHAGLSHIFYEWNHLEDAIHHAQQCIELSLQWESAEFQAIGYVMLARLEQAHGHLRRAQEAMNIAEELISTHPLSQKRTIGIKSALARLWITQGDLERVSLFLQKRDIKIDDETSYLREPEYLILLRLLLSQNDCTSALLLTDRLRQKAEATNRQRQVIEVLVLQALAFQGKSELDQALTSLAQALSLAHPERYVRTFLDEGVPMTKLLHQARMRGIAPRYIAEILSAMGQIVGSAQSAAQTLIEPLTTRELEVLKLIEAGCSNQKIADKLVISIATVKRHISNIYVKLGAKSRTQAVSLGKELGLFP